MVTSADGARCGSRSAWPVNELLVEIPRHPDRRLGPWLLLHALTSVFCRGPSWALSSNPSTARSDCASFHGERPVAGVGAVPTPC
jgi:hypothetical protein